MAGAGAAEGFPRSARIRKRADFLRVQQRGKKRGVATLCIGGGEGTAVALELL